MNIAKLIFLACHVFLASLLLVISPAHASTRWEVAPNSQMTVSASVQPISKLAAPILTPADHQTVNQTGCSCSACVQANFQQLQGKLPIINCQ